MGDPAGVGPEIIVGAWMETVVHEWCRPLVVGHPEIMRRAVAMWQTGAKVVEIASPDEAEPSLDVIPCIRCGGEDVLAVRPGVLDARAGHAAYEAVVRAARLAQEGTVDAIVTAPLQKEALHRAGHHFPGHTELLAQLCGVTDFAMVLYLGPDEQVLAPYGLAVVHVTLHTALRKVFELLSIEEILAKARLADRFMSGLMQPFREGEAPAEPSEKPPSLVPPAARREPRPPGIVARPPGIVKSTTIHPRIGVCSLNPHGGEGGLFGEEEQTIIRPAVEKGVAEGLRLVGPLPTDTLMVRAGRAFRRHRGNVSRPGAHRPETDGHAPRGECHIGPADHPHERRPRHCVRYRLAPAGRNGQHGRSHPHRRATSGKPEPEGENAMIHRISRRNLLAAAAGGMVAGTSAGIGFAAEIRKQPRVAMVQVTDLFRPFADPDDHWDLACTYALAVRGDVDLLAVMIDYPPALQFDPDVQAVAQLNYLTGLSAPVVVGSPRRIDLGEVDRPENKAVLGGMRALLEILRKSPLPVIINILGSSRDVALAGKLEPKLFAEKCAGIYLNAGSGTPDNDLAARREYNVSLDPVSYGAIFELPCPVFWMPCFEVAPGPKGEPFVAGPHGTYYQFPQKEILPRLSARLQNYFAFVFKQGLPEREKQNESDALRPNWLHYMQGPNDPEWLARLGDLQRNMWCTAGFLHAAGLSVDAGGRIAPAEGDSVAGVFVRSRCGAVRCRRRHQMEARSAREHPFSVPGSRPVALRDGYDGGDADAVGRLVVKCTAPVQKQLRVFAVRPCRLPEQARRLHHKLFLDSASRGGFCRLG